jgi:hypothetical protein
VDFATALQRIAEKVNEYHAAEAAKAHQHHQDSPKPTPAEAQEPSASKEPS